MVRFILAVACVCGVARGEILLLDPIVLPLDFDPIAVDGGDELVQLKHERGGKIWFGNPAEFSGTDRTFTHEGAVYDFHLRNSTVSRPGDVPYGSLNFIRPEIGDSNLTIDSGAATLFDLQIFVPGVQIQSAGEVLVPIRHDDNSIQVFLNNEIIYQYLSNSSNAGARDVDIRVPVQSLTELSLRYKAFGIDEHAAGLDVEVKPIRFYPGSVSVPEVNPFGDLFDGLGGLLGGW
ncbi:MAG: hypothetical protein ACO35D_05560 [Aquiluna sp.]